MVKVTLYTLADCPFCIRAKHFLEKKGVSYTEISVDNQPELYEEMKMRSGHDTAPQIFIDDKPIGGCDDLYALDRAGNLNKLLHL